MNFRLIRHALAMILAAALFVPAGAQEIIDKGNFAAAAHASYSGLASLSDGMPVIRSSSTLVRNVNGVSFALSTSGLDPESAYTTWWVIFNNPEHCAGVPCAESDLFEPAVNGSVAWAAGEISDPFGQAGFAGHLLFGETASGSVLFGPGLANRRAEIHLVVRTHGAAAALTAEQLEAALTSFEGACDVNDCEDQQFAVHLR